MRIQSDTENTKKCEKLQWQGCVSSLWSSEMKSWTREHRQWCAMDYRHPSSERGEELCSRGRSTEPLKSPLTLLPACNTLLINKLSHFSCTQYQGAEWCSRYLNIMKYVIRHAQLEVKKYNVLVRSFQACWLKHLTFYFHLCMSYRTGLNLILHTGTYKNFGGSTHFKKILHPCYPSGLSFCMKGREFFIIFSQRLS